MYRLYIILAFLFVLSVNIFAQKKLENITIEGLQNERERAVLSMLPVIVGQSIDNKDISRAIKQLYRSERFRNIEIIPENETENSISLRIVVVENPYMDVLELRGSRRISRNRLTELLKVRHGERLSDARVHSLTTIIRNAYADRGYLNAEIITELIETKVPGFVILKFTINEGDRVRVESINFSGNVEFSERKLRRTFKTKERHIFSSGEFNSSVFRQHLDSLVLSYNEEGFMDARIVRDSVRNTEDGRGIIIDIEVSEGQRFFVGDFYFLNNEIIDSEHLQAAVTMQRGRPFSRTRFLMTRQSVGNVYRNEGYLWANAEPRYKYRNDTIDVIFTITEGRPAIIRKVEISGNEKTREQVIRREIRVFPGQKYDQSGMERSIRDIRQLNYFDNVLPDIAMNPDGTVDMLFNVQEKENIGQFSAGVTYSQQDRFGGNFSVSIPNFRGAGQNLDAMIEVAKGRQRYSIGFMEPWMFNTPTSFSSQIFYEDVKYTNEFYNYTRAGIEYGAGRRLKWPDDYFSATLRHLLSYDYNRTGAASLPSELRDEVDIVTKGILSRWYLGIARNDTDYPQFPTQGSIFRIGGFIGGTNGEPFNSELETYSFVKGIVSYDWYLPLFWKFVLGAKTKFGMISSFIDRPKLGYSDLFSVGGVYYDGIVRGYDEGEISVNLNMATVSGEIRFPIVDQQFYMGTFFDMGNGWIKYSDIDITDMKRGTGFGFRLMLPMIGLLGFDFAWGLDNPNANFMSSDYKPKFNLHFIMNRGF
ncbi:MAG: outer membrane protein assembly factor BamA [Chitinivibrionia bacterium]|nr:outer membrane protein assembly factor BamA [Chitinivibrionia bacterium]